MKVAGVEYSQLNVCVVLVFESPMMKSSEAVNNTKTTFTFFFIVEESMGSEGLWFRSRHRRGG